MPDIRWTTETLHLLGYLVATPSRSVSVVKVIPSKPYIKKRKIRIYREIYKLNFGIFNPNISKISSNRYCHQIKMLTKNQNISVIASSLRSQN